ncbi:uncharacterized protein BYT42DRAFT_547802 [Radiomyces spectabilis]|uniref:uncharacterized protein n=1 Tax=Radiomyces spectabilis TaxID=64574 RepID=UPI00221F4EA0|nr:uncharacterized protein BYT42DRAFT_547802 [Radiomyces spectabilis]KAI8372746.1 hypothetical protein BYT42DRAFT_547802 [Radiomyces spectabilis]
MLAPNCSPVIIMDKNNKAVLVNTVEIYGRQRSLDVHRESFAGKKGKSASSSLPPVTTKYHYTWATIMTDDEGDKLVVGIKTLNALITSNLRINSVHEASIGGILSHFELDENAALTASIFLDTDSVKKASSFASTRNANKVARFDLRTNFSNSDQNFSTLRRISFVAHSAAWQAIAMHSWEKLKTSNHQQLLHGFLGTGNNGGRNKVDRFDLRYQLRQL